MRYIGGKSRIAKAIAEAILADTDQRYAYLEPFVGGGSVFSVLAPKFEATGLGDTSTDLILMWDALRNGWEPQETVTEAEYSELNHAEPSALRGLVGFGGSFGGKWFGGYARGGKNANGTPRNHYGESRRAAMRVARSMTTSVIECKPYWEWKPRRNTVVYCDPPYEATQTYDAVDAFDSRKFWEVVTGWSVSGALVYVSEYHAPDGWEPLATFNHKLSLTKTEQGRPERIETLWKVSA